MSLDQYEILEQLGTGSFGTVSRIRRKIDNKVLVWKEINFGGMSEKEKSQLVAEVNILRELRNPFVVRYHDRIVDKPRTRLYIIMEHCAGGDLGKLIKKQRKDRTHIDESFVWKILAQSVVALKECHRRLENGECKPILHRDLKPANILLDADQNIKMADFGLAKELSSQSKLAKTNVGTPFYMAPEIINEKDYDEKSDIWSLGCLLYELAALKPPFEASNAVSLAMKINTGKYPRIPLKYSDTLSDVIKLLLQTDPKRRPRVEDLENLSAIQPYISSARAILNDYKMQHNYAIKVKELKMKEDNLQMKEEQLLKFEASLKEKERELQALEKKLFQAKEQFEFQVQNQQQVSMEPKRRSSVERMSDCMMIDEDQLDWFDKNHFNAPPMPPAPPAMLENPIPIPTAAPRMTNDYRRGPVPMPSSNKISQVPNTQPFTIHQDTYLDNNNNITKKASLITGSEMAKENVNPGQNKPFRTHTSKLALVDQNRRTNLNEYQMDGPNFLSPTKKLKQNNQPFGYRNENLPSNVQIDLNTLLRPKAML